MNIYQIEKNRKFESQNFFLHSFEVGKFVKIHQICDLYFKKTSYLIQFYYFRLENSIRFVEQIFLSALKIFEKICQVISESV